MIRYAFEVAKDRPRKKLTMVDKANAVRAYDLWTRVFAEVGKDYPQIEQDPRTWTRARCGGQESGWLSKWWVVPNMFGDIITDLGARLQGGMGAAASATFTLAKLGMFATHPWFGAQVRRQERG